MGDAAGQLPDGLHLLRLPQLLFQAAARFFAQRLAYRHRKLLHAMLQNIISRAFLHIFHRGFIAQASGHHDERNIFAGLAQHLQALIARPGAQVVIGKHGVIFGLLKVGLKLLQRIHHIERY